MSPQKRNSPCLFQGGEQRLHALALGSALGAFERGHQCLALAQLLRGLALGPGQRAQQRLDLGPKPEVGSQRTTQTELVLV